MDAPRPISSIEDVERLTADARNRLHSATHAEILSGATTDLASGTTRAMTATIEDAAGNTITSGADGRSGSTAAFRCAGSLCGSGP